MHWAKQKVIFFQCGIEISGVVYNIMIDWYNLSVSSLSLGTLSAVLMHTSPVDLKITGKSCMLEKLGIWQSLVYLHNLTWNQLILYIEEQIWKLFCAWRIKWLIEGMHRNNFWFKCLIFFIILKTWSLLAQHKCYFEINTCHFNCASFTNPKVRLSKFY